MSNKSIILNEIKNLNVNSISSKDFKLFFGHLKLSGEDVERAIRELITDGQLINVKNRLYLPNRIGFVRGKVIGNEKGFAFLKPDSGSEDYFIAPKNLGDAISGDIVLAKIIDHNNYGQKQNGGKSKQEVRVEKIISHSLETVVGVFEKNGSACFVIPQNKKLNKDIFIPGNSSANAKVGQIVNVKITEVGSRGESMVGEIIEILGYPNDAGVDILAVAREYGLTEQFPQPVLEEADRLPDSINVADYPNRQKFFEDVITIDGEDTRDIDDAISCKKEDGGYRLWVHIADVAQYVKQGEKIDEEAFIRGTSVYFPNYVIPMLPIKLSNGICSLHEGVDRLTLTCEMLFDSKGKMVDSKLYESVIKSSHRMTYNQVQSILDGDVEVISKFEDVSQMILDMSELAKILEAKLKKRGSLDFEIAEPYIKVDEAGKTVDIVKRERRESEKIIEFFMISANEAVAETFYNMEMPCVYRVHGTPDDKRVMRFAQWCNGFGESFKVKGELKNRDMQNFLKNISEKSYGSILSKLALRTMEKAVYSNENGGHYGLASECYCHFTSPIRRYPDLTVHRFVKMLVNNQLFNKDITELDNMAFESAENSSITERNADEAEREVDDMKKAEWLAQFVGDSFEGVVSGVTNFGVFVELENTCEGLIDIHSLKGKTIFDDEKQFIKSGEGLFRLGKKVKVRLIKANAEEREIDFSFVEFLEKENEKNNLKHKSSKKKLEK